MNNGYFISLNIGCICGAYLLGSLNVWLSGEFILAKSILGGLVGAIICVESYKYRFKIYGSTGYIYIVPFTMLVIVGRIGCFLSGVRDYTYGIETMSKWGVDLGDQVLRHPVQLYESVSLVVALLMILLALRFRPHWVVKNGFYFCAGFYASQRLVWEFFKPYHKLFLSLNVFQIVCIGLLVYSIGMSLKQQSHANT